MKLTPLLGLVLSSLVSLFSCTKYLDESHFWDNFEDLQEATTAKDIKCQVRLCRIKKIKQQFDSMHYFENSREHVFLLHFFETYCDFFTFLLQSDFQNASQTGIMLFNETSGMKMTDSVVLFDRFVLELCYCGSILELETTEYLNIGRLAIREFDSEEISFWFNHLMEISCKKEDNEVLSESVASTYFFSFFENELDTGKDTRD